MLLQRPGHKHGHGLDDREGSLVPPPHATLDPETRPCCDSGTGSQFGPQNLPVVRSKQRSGYCIAAAPIECDRGPHLNIRTVANTSFGVPIPHTLTTTPRNQRHPGLCFTCPFVCPLIDDPTVPEEMGEIIGVKIGVKEQVRGLGYSPPFPRLLSFCLQHSSNLQCPKKFGVSV